MTSHRLQLTLKSSLTELERVNEACQELVDADLLPDRTRWIVQLAVEEMATNTIVHGYQRRTDGALDLDILVGPGSVQVTLTDAAPEFNPLLAPAVDVAVPLRERQVGGLGIHLVRRLMDHVEYARLNGKNRLSMEKRF